MNESKPMPSQATAQHQEAVKSEIKKQKADLSAFKRHLKKETGSIPAGHHAIEKMERDIKATNGLIDRYNTRAKLARMSPDDESIKAGLKADYDALQELVVKHGG